MLPDHLSEEGPAELEEIEVPFSIISSLLVILTILYFIHFNDYFDIFGLITRVFLRMYHIWTSLQDVIFYWYFILHFNYNIKDKDRLPDSAQTRDQPIDLNINYEALPESRSLTTEIIRSIRQQIYFQQNTHTDEIPIITTFTGNITHISQNIVNLPVYVNIPPMYELPKIQQNQQLCHIHCF